jgi:hypothetical protein
VIATIMPITTNTTIAICIHIQVGDMKMNSLPAETCGNRPAPLRRRLTYSDMRRRIFTGMVSLLLASCAFAPGAVSAKAKGAPGQSSLLGGVNIISLDGSATPAEVDHAIEEARALHAKVVRTNVAWSAFEPTEPGHMDASSLAVADRLMSDASDAGIRVIVSVDSTPCWASSAPSSILARCAPNHESEANAWPPVDPTSYAAFVAYLAQRYSATLAAIEIWNEPDQANEDYLAGPNKAEHDAALQRAAYPAIKAVDPSLPVLAGSLVGSNGAFLRALYAAGIKGYYNGLAVHYYNLTIASLRSIREVQMANGDTTPLWLDEFGWSSCWPSQSIEQEQGCVTPQMQGRNLRDMYRELARMPYVAAAVAYKLDDSSDEDFGLTSAGGARKPAFAAFASALTLPFGAISPIVLSLRRKGAKLVASGSAPVGDFMQLEAFRGKVLRYRALFTLDRFNRYSIALPSVLGTRGLRVRISEYANDALKAAQKLG